MSEVKLSDECNAVDGKFEGESNFTEGTENVLAESFLVDALDSSISSSQQAVLTSPCGICGKVSTKRDRVFDCSKCKSLTHLSCSRLPAYAIYSLKTSKRQYVCAKCSAPPDEYVKLYDLEEDEEKVTTKVILDDVFAEVKRVGDSVAKFDVERQMQILHDKLKTIDTIDRKLDETKTK